MIFDKSKFSWPRGLGLESSSLQQARPRPRLNGTRKAVCNGLSAAQVRNTSQVGTCSCSTTGRQVGCCQWQLGRFCTGQAGVLAGGCLPGRRIGRRYFLPVCPAGCACQAGKNRRAGLPGRLAPCPAAVTSSLHTYLPGSLGRPPTYADAHLLHPAKPAWQATFFIFILFLFYF